MKNRIKMLSYNISKSFRWHRRHFQLKYPFLINRIYQFLKTLLVIFSCISLLCAFMYKTEIIVIKNNTIIFDINKSFTHINMSGIITSQISVTMIVVSIISLIAGSENKYIFGKRAIELVFPKKPFNSFTIYLVVLFLLAFFNIYFLINKFGDSLILTDFIVAIFIVAICVFRFANIFINQNQIKKKLRYRYYKDNLKHIKKFKPLADHKSKNNEILKNVTIKHIRENNVPVYSQNIDLHFSIIEPALFKHKHLIQNYYSEPAPHYDLISNVLEFAQELIYNKKTKESLLLYNRLFDRLNYFQIINVSDISLHHLSKKYIDEMKSIKKESEISDYSYLIIGMIKKLNYQIYLYSITDLSYCRLAKNTMHLWTSNDLLEKYYLSIYENKNLSKIEKSRLYTKMFDDIRLMYPPFSYETSCIDDFINKIDVNDNKVIYPVEIIAEPVSLMILKMFENQDYENILLFLLNGDTETYNAVRLFVVLSISEAILRKKREFRMDINIKATFCAKTLKASNIIDMNTNVLQLSELYKLIVNNYTKKRNKYPSGSFYGFCPVFSYSKNVVDTIFLIISERINQKDTFIKQINTSEIKKDSLVEKQIEKFCNQ